MCDAPQDRKPDACSSDDDCPGSKVCCSFGPLEASTCIRQSACSDSQCSSSSGATGFCDGG
ncbi:hypothetical protein EXIGLDRAFT_307581 [Exidia glandulosa HHB12029]|uniref:WAP domain-containing protein n=1 Tax=Exidia glandulosa HHB12029 TaxID=1314781 RepID=A0A165ZL35_EXIGL|nr:hypothetical protein EXIGLDRAFT_307581 [Exidia glandulosa HHB12029]